MACCLDFLLSSLFNESQISQVDPVFKEKSAHLCTEDSLLSPGVMDIITKGLCLQASCFTLISLSLPVTFVFFFFCFELMWNTPPYQDACHVPDDVNIYITLGKKTKTGL